MATQLWGIREFSDVFLDALVRNEAGQLMFASLYGRDTAIQQLLAAFSLPVTSGGVAHITLKPVEAPPRVADGVVGVVPLHPATPAADDPRGVAYIGDAARLTKLAGKLPKKSLFGPVSHVFIYDSLVIDPDTANGRAWVLTQGDGPEHLDSVWAMIQRISPVPLIDAWMAPVLEHLGDAVIKDLSPHNSSSVTWPTLGPIQASVIDLGESFSQAISELVQRRVLKRPDAAGDVIQQDLPLAA
ncbi:MAG: hypothetical protein IPG66_14935 [Hydrogenophilales bacterium]|nr:hypothetical protein [Hydrogenophilales bacterium]